MYSDVINFWQQQHDITPFFVDSGNAGLPGFATERQHVFDQNTECQDICDEHTYSLKTCYELCSWRSFGRAFAQQWESCVLIKLTGKYRLVEHPKTWLEPALAIDHLGRQSVEYAFEKAVNTELLTLPAHLFWQTLEALLQLHASSPDILERLWKKTLEGFAHRTFAPLAIQAPFHARGDGSVLRVL